MNSADSTRTNRDAADATIGVPADIAAGVRPPRILPIGHGSSPAFLLLTLGCSAADLVQRQRATPRLSRKRRSYLPLRLHPPSCRHWSSSPCRQTESPAIIIPPGMDPNAVLPELPSATPVILSRTESKRLSLASRARANVHQSAGSNCDANARQRPHHGGFRPSDLRTGPGVEYPQIAQLWPQHPSSPSSVAAQTAPGWKSAVSAVSRCGWLRNTLSLTMTSPLRQNRPPKRLTATPTGTPTETPTPTPTYTPTPYPFELAIGPQFFPTNNEYITIWVKLYVGIRPPRKPHRTITSQ